MKIKIAKFLVFISLSALSVSCSEQARSTPEILPVEISNTVQQDADFKTQWHWLFQKSGTDKLTNEELEIIERVTEKGSKKSNSQELPHPKQYDLLDSIQQ